MRNLCIDCKPNSIVVYETCYIYPTGDDICPCVCVVFGKQ